MKNFVFVLGLVCLSLGLAHAGSFSVKVANQKNATNSVAYGTVAGKLNTIVVDVTGTTTQTLTVTSGRTGETILSKAFSADAVIRPRFMVHTTAGVAIGVGTNDLEKFYLSNDTLTFSLTETAAATNSTTITVITE